LRIQACLVINSALVAGMTWEDISTMVATETAAGTVASLFISSLAGQSALFICIVSDHIVLRGYHQEIPLQA
jgi:hypothetical protein